jgi:hypothetical protein
MNLLKNIAINLFLLAQFFLLNSSIGASFDCAKAKTIQEKLICNTDELNSLDSKMGETYSSVKKSFQLKGFIELTQKDWLSSYRNCKDIKSCAELLTNRIREINEYRDYSAYTDYDGGKITVDGATIFLFNRDNKPYLRIFGNWMTDMNMDPNKIKGYPYDGMICDNEYELKKKGNSYEIDEDGVTFLIDKEKITMKGHISCSPRTSFGEGVYKRIK